MNAVGRIGSRPPAQWRSSVRFRLAVVALVAVVALLAAACTPGKGGTTAPSGAVTLKLQANAVNTKNGKNYAEASWIVDYVIPNFEKQMSAQGKKVTVQFSGSGAADEDYKTRLVLDLKSGGGADVVDIDGPWIGEFVQAGYLKPLDQVVGPEVNSWDGWTQIPKAIAGMTEVNGKRYGVPVGTDGRVLYFNKKLFTQAGLPADWQPKSWDDILAAARQLKSRLPGVTPLQLNAGTAMGEATTSQGFLPLLYGTGTNIIDQATGKWVGDTAGVRQVLTFYQQVYGQGLGNKNLQLRADGRDRSFQDFSKNKIAILLEGDYFWRSVINPSGGLAPMNDRDQVVGWALIPAMRPGSGLGKQDFVSLSGGGARMINPRTQHPKEAWALLQYLNSKQALTDFVRRGARLTSRNDVNQSALTDPLLRFIAQKVLPITATRPGSALYPQISIAAQTATENVVSGRSSPARAAAQFGSAVGKTVGAGNVENAAS
jgi:multiple sugar transport system substrate-binding protein